MGTRYFSGMLGSSPFGGGFNQLNTGAGLGFQLVLPSALRQPCWSRRLHGGLRAAIGYSSNINDLKDSQTGFATADNTRAITAGLR